MRRAVLLRSNDYWYQFFLGYIVDLDGRPEEALEHYSSAVVLQSTNPYVRYSRARLYRSTGRWLNALEDFKIALNGLRGSPEERRVLIERGVLYQTMGDFVRARKDYDAVAKQDARDDHGRTARLNTANLDAESGELARALREYDALLAEDIRDTSARQSRAILELRMGRPLLADRDLSVLLKMTSVKDKKRVEFLAGRAQARLMMGRADDAVADASEARRIHPYPAHDRLEQRALLAARRYDRLAIDRPDDVALLPLQGAGLAADLRAAAAELGRTAAGHDAAAFRAGLTRACILAALGDTRTALAAADRSASSSRYGTLAPVIRARVLIAAGRHREAAADIERGLSIQPGDPGLLELRAALRLADGNPRGAIDDYNRACSQGVREELYLGKAAALLALGEYRSALAEWSWALRRDPELPEAYLGRARTHFLVREWDLGLADLEQASAWGHGDPGIEATVTLSYLKCLPMRPERLPRLLVHLRRAAAAYWYALDGQYRLTAGADRTS